MKVELKDNVHCLVDRFLKPLAHSGPSSQVELQSLGHSGAGLGDPGVLPLHWGYHD